MKQLFVSYAREDRSRVEPLVASLRSAGFEVFWDQSMRGGDIFRDLLEAQLATAHRLLVLWTASSVGSSWVRDEADEAMQQNKLLPVLLDDVRPPLGFRQVHCFDLIGWQGTLDDPRLARLAGELHGPEGGGGAGPRPPPPGPPSPYPNPPPPPPTWRRPLVIAIAAAALLWAAFDGWFRGSEPYLGPASPASAASTPAGPAASARVPDAPMAPSPSSSARRCAAIKDQVALGNPVSESDRAFLKAGCR